MLMAGLSSLREVIAFPKTTAARALFEGAPAPVQDDELRELHIAVTKRLGKELRIGKQHESNTALPRKVPIT